MCLNGKVALVTGGGSGIGRSIALAYAKAGACVTVADINDEGGQETVRMICNTGKEASYINADISDAVQVSTLIERVVKLYGRLDCACNNAGIEGYYACIADIIEEDWDHTIKVNLKGVWLCMKYEIRQMLKQGCGSIINIASVGGMLPCIGYGDYSTSKAGVIQLTRTAAIEYAKHGIRINAVCPGGIDTPMIDRINIAIPERKKLLSESQPIGRLGKPEEIADVVIWLSSEAASFVIAHSMVVDGGSLAK
ncbi:MAG: short chain dehydrogenase [Clostridiales bacterium GWC2_40_7]|nr:MAG: short chain dehydrogenase [Clostridiales bacterium GWC2_40_7]